jgi:hypothetical protein
MFYTGAMEVGRRCYPGQDIEVQEELTRSVSRIDAYVAANSSPSWTSEEIEGFKRVHGLVGASEEHLCRDDLKELYRSFVSYGAVAIRNDVDAMLARPGTPTMGECL